MLFSGRIPNNHEAKLLISRRIIYSFSALLALAGAGLFAMQTDDREHNGFRITRGPAFYIQVRIIFPMDFLVLFFTPQKKNANEWEKFEYFNYETVFVSSKSVNILCVLILNEITS